MFTVRCHRIVFASLLAATYLLASPAFAAEPTFVVPDTNSPLVVLTPLPGPINTSSAALVPVDESDALLTAQLIPGIDEDGLPCKKTGQVIAQIPAGKGGDADRRFVVEQSNRAALPVFSLKDLDDQRIALSQGDDPVFVYVHDEVTDESVPEKDSRRTRGVYVHPIYGLSGEVLTDDFPKDHYHHHGLFWTWPHVKVDGKEHSLWEYKTIRQKPVRKLYEQVGPLAAVLAFENGWFVMDENGEFTEKVMIERVWLIAHKATDTSRAIDVLFTWIPTDHPITLQGAGGKSYGGLTLRLKGHPATDMVVRHPGGETRPTGGLASNEDLSNTRLPWADFTRTFEGADAPSGAAVFVPTSHPDYPPTWLTRTYGPLCCGWPGVKDKTFPAGEPIRLRYRVWIHKEELSVDQLKDAYDAFLKADEATCR